MKGSSLPNFSGTPNSLNFAVRAFCRWHASWTIWSLATVGFGQHLYQPGFGGSAPQELSIWLVAAVAGIAALAGAGVLALIERINRRPAQVWLVVSTAGLILSLGGPLSGEGISTANRLALVSMHLAAGAVMIPLLYRSAQFREEENQSGTEQR